MMLAEDQVDRLSAALRHRWDSQELLPASPDQAWHLAGFATECARKACLSREGDRRALSHLQGAEADRILDLVLAIDAHASRFDLRGWAPAGSALADWSEQHRYDRSGRHVARARALVSEVAHLHDRTLTALWLAEPALDLRVL